MFIVLDGTDGSGKATQTQRMMERLKAEGYDVASFSFPRYGNPSCFFVEKYLRGEYGTDVDAKRASLFFALDRYDAAPEIRAALERGAIVLSDRYVSANKGHQTAKLRTTEERRTFLDWVNELEYETLGIPKPDLTILLHVPADVSFGLIAKKDERGYLNGKPRDIHEADRGHIHAAEAAYLSLLDLDTAEHWKIVECMSQEQLLSIEAIHDRLWTLIQPLLPPR